MGTRKPLEAAYALPAAFTTLLVIGAAAAGLNGRLGPNDVLGAASAVCLVVSAAATWTTAPLVAGMAWMTAVSFSQPPYGQLHAGGGLAARCGVVLTLCAVIGAAAGALLRSTIDLRRGEDDNAVVSESPDPTAFLRDLAVAVGRRRQLTALGRGAAVNPHKNVHHEANPTHVNLDDVLQL
ncbi:MAG: hypothetical protein ACTHK4_14670 [Mycobacteriales bacterium]